MKRIREPSIDYNILSDRTVLVLRDLGFMNRMKFVYGILFNKKINLIGTNKIYYAKLENKEGDKE